MIEIPPVIIEKPKFGEKCNGCGLCCSMSICAIGKDFLGDVPAPCPMLTYENGRYWCGFVLMENEAQKIKQELKPLIAESLGVGLGCDAQHDEF